MREIATGYDNATVLMACGATNAGSMLHNLSKRSGPAQAPHSTVARIGKYQAHAAIEKRRFQEPSA
jgi:hypothetical protein